MYGLGSVAKRHHQTTMTQAPPGAPQKGRSIFAAPFSTVIAIFLLPLVRNSLNRNRGLYA